MRSTRSPPALCAGAVQVPPTPVIAPCRTWNVRWLPTAKVCGARALSARRATTLRERANATNRRPSALGRGSSRGRNDDGTPARSFDGIRAAALTGELAVPRAIAPGTAPAALSVADTVYSVKLVPAAASAGVSVLCTTNVPSFDGVSIEEPNAFDAFAASCVTPPVGVTKPDPAGGGVGVAVATGVGLGVGRMPPPPPPGTEPPPPPPPHAASAAKKTTAKAGRTRKLKPMASPVRRRRAPYPSSLRIAACGAAQIEHQERRHADEGEQHAERHFGGCGDRARERVGEHDE